MGSRKQPARTLPIRLTLVGMFVIPLLSLVALWGFAASVTLGPSIQEGNYKAEYNAVGRPAQVLGVRLAAERLRSFIWLSASPRAPGAQMYAERRRTNAAVTALRHAAVRAQGVTFATAKPALAAFIAQLGRLNTIRAAIDAGTMKAVDAFQEYNSIIDTEYKFYDAAIAVPDVPLYRQSVATVQAGYALELAGREAALVGGALAARGRMSPGERKLFAQIVANQRYVIGVALAQLNPQLRAPYAQVYASPAYASFKLMEDRILGSAGSNAPIPVSPRAWQAASQSFLRDFAAAWTNKEAADLTQGGSELGNRLQLRLVLAGGAGLAAVVASIFLMLRFGRRITRELTGLLDAARTLAEDRLPVVVSRLRRGEDVDVATDAPPLTLRSRTTEITKIAQAFSTVQRTAVEAAVGQAELRKGVNQVFRSLARRSQSLLHRQLRMLDSMERRTEEPDALADLFRLDHLTTRMRRHAEGLIILSGAAPGRGWRSPVPVVDVLRGAIGEIEEYVRVDLSTDSQDAVAGAAVADVIHLLAELIENATAFSPPNTRVSVKADRVGTGFVVEIEDRGLGITTGQVAAINNRLANPPEFDLADSDRLGLFVVSQLARSHGIRVSLRGSPYGGTTAIVLMPHGIVVPEGEAGTYSGTDDHARALASGAGNAPSPQMATRSTGWDPTSSNDGPRGLMRSGPSQDPPDLEPVGAQAWRSAGPPSPAGSATELVPHEHQQSLTPAGQVPAAARALLGLPRRVRQASLAPQLRDGASAEAATLGDGAHDTRSPEEARSLFMSLQRGWRRGRAEAGQPGDGLAGAPDTSSDASSSEAR